MPFVKGTPKPPGSGRKKGGTNKIGSDVRELAQVHTPAALAALVEVMNDKEAPPAARVMAAQAILDRGHGKVPQAITGGPPAPVVNLELVRQQILAKIERAAASPGDSSLAARIGRRLIEGRAIRHGHADEPDGGPDGGAS
jgi:hypothetical protein